MKSDLQKVSALERKLNIEVPVTTVKEAFDRAYKNAQKHAEIKGFRKGKAPLNMIRGMYKDKVFPDVVQDLIQTHYSKALGEHELIPVNAPSVDIETVGEELDLKFSASFEIKPEISKINYEGLSVLKEKLIVTDAMVDEQISHLQKRQTQTELLTEDRPAKTGDSVVINFEGFVNGIAINEVKGEKMPVEIGGGQFVPGFEENLMGLRPGDEKSFDQAMPSDYHFKEIAGKTVTFKIKVLEIRVKIVPAIDDAFAKKFGKDTIAAFKEDLHKNIVTQEEGRIREDFKKRLLTALADANPVEIPKSLRDEQKQKLVEDFKQRMMSQGMSADEYEKYKSDWDADFDKTANFLVHSYFLVDKLARDNNLRPKEGDLEKELINYSATSGIDITELRKYYSNPDLRSRLSYQVTENNIIKLLENTAKIKEVEKDKLTQPS